MSRPKRVFPKSLPLFNKLHSQKVKMIFGTYLTALHQIKETAQYYISIDSWAFCCSKFKMKKKNVELKVDLPVLEDEQAIQFLEKKAWHNYVAKYSLKSDLKEALTLLNKLYPLHEKVFFYELKSIIAAYCNGVFVSYDDDGQKEEPHEQDIKQREYYATKYRYNPNGRVVLPDYIHDLYEAYTKIEREEQKVEKQKAFDKYYDAESAYIYKNYGLTDLMIKLAKNSIVCPHIFARPTVEGFSYEHAGEIYFIITPGKIYFETDRHF